VICAQCGGTAPPRKAGETRILPCEKCKLPLGIKECPQCSAGIFGPENYCAHCGSNLKAKGAPSELSRQLKVLEAYLPERVMERLLASEHGVVSERKYATIVFADVSGFTAMSEQLSAEEVTKTMNEVFEGMVTAVHRYDGTVDKFIGDCVMAIFGAPIAHDNDPERALLACLDMMTFVREFSDRTGRGLGIAIGINAGPVVAGSVGGHGRLNYSVMGDTVNTAQRLEAAAGKGRILVTKEVYQRTKEVVRFKALAPIKVKGKRNPIDVWEARERRPRSGTQVQGSTFVGRKQELDQIRQVMGNGGLVAVVGEAGVGRTALVDQLAASAHQGGIPVARAACPPYAPERTAGLLTESVAQLLKIRVDQGIGAIKDGRAKLVELGLSEQEAALLLAGAAREKVDSASLDYESTIRATCAAYFRVLSASARGRLLVILEDLQCASPTERAQMGILLASAPPPGITLLVTLRPEATKLLEGKEAVKRLPIEPLPKAEVRALVAARLGLPTLEEAVAERIYAFCRGNPRMLEELMQSLTDQGVIFRSRQRWIVSPKLNEVAVPPGIEGLAAARIDELDPDARRFVQAAGLVGTEFDPEMVRRVGGFQVDLEWVISQLIDRRIVVADGGRNALLRFTHESYRSVAAETLSTDERRGLNARIGQYLEETADLKDPRALQKAAHHLAGGVDMEKGVKFLLRAAKKLVEVHQVDSAIEMLERLCSLAAPQGIANHVLSQSENELDEGLYHLGMLYLRKGQLPEAENRLQWAYGRSKQFFNGDFRVWSLFGLAQLARARNRPDQARTHLETASAEAAGMRDPALVAVAMLEQSRLHNLNGEGKAALEITAKALEMEKKITPELRANLPQQVSPALILIERGQAFHQSGSPFEAAKAFEGSHQAATEAKDDSARGHAALALAKLAAARQDFDGAFKLNSEALTCFKSVGDRIAEGRCLHNLAATELARGQLPRANGALKHAERIFSEIGHREGLAFVGQMKDALRKASQPAPKKA
jgi:class 3 adenylate cyclase/tetratricopeptide (TPR) repeat protein